MSSITTNPLLFSLYFNPTKFCQTAVHAVANRISSAEPSILRLLINPVNVNVDLIFVGRLLGHLLSFSFQIVFNSYGSKQGPMNGLPITTPYVTKDHLQVSKL